MTFAMSEKIRRPAIQAGWPLLIFGTQNERMGVEEDDVFRSRKRRFAPSDRPGCGAAALA